MTHEGALLLAVEHNLLALARSVLSFWYVVVQLTIIRMTWFTVSYDWHCRSSVGVSGSRKTMFYAPVTDSMKVGQGGGNAHEGEFIEVVEMKVDECLHNMLHNDTVERSIGVVFSLLWFQQFKAA